MSKCLVMLIEDDTKIISSIVKSLKCNNYHCFVARNTRDGLNWMMNYRPEFIIADLDVNHSDEILKNIGIRQLAKIPVIILGNNDSSSEKIKFLDMGADDYVVKPFITDEIIARMRAINRRVIISSNSTGCTVFNNGELAIDYNSRSVMSGNNELHLTPIEYKLLCLLSNNVGKVLSHTLITKEIWGTCWESDMASLRVYIAALRKKLNIKRCQPGFIETQVGVGYKMIKK